MTAVLAAGGLGKRYGRHWALRDCNLAVPEGRVVGLVGPNGAGKTTFLHLAVGLLAPTAGTVTVLDRRPGDSPAALARRFRRTGHAGVHEADCCEAPSDGRLAHPGWDGELAAQRIGQLGLDLVSVIMSSHLVTDLERVCDYLIVLIASRVQVAGDVNELPADWAPPRPRHAAGQPGHYPGQPHRQADHAADACDGRRGPLADDHPRNAIATARDDQGWGPPAEIPCRLFAEPMSRIEALVPAQIILFGEAFGRVSDLWGRTVDATDRLP